MQTLLGFFICLVLLSTGSTLECEVCSDIAKSCSGSLQTCRAGQDTCTIVLTVDSLNAPLLPIVTSSVYTISKGCGSSSDCKSVPVYLNVGNGLKLWSSTTCCVGNACKTVKPPWYPDSTKTNGKRCPACYSNSIDIVKKCKEGETVNCVGPEDKCLDLEMTIIFGKRRFKSFRKGCATQSGCDYIKPPTPLARDVRINKFECNTAPNASP